MSQRKLNWVPRNTSLNWTESNADHLLETKRQQNKHEVGCEVNIDTTSKTIFQRIQTGKYTHNKIRIIQITVNIHSPQTTQSSGKEKPNEHGRCMEGTCSLETKVCLAGGVGSRTINTR